MAFYENREYFDMLMCLGRCDGNEGRAINLYADRFPQRRRPSRNVIVRLRDRLVNGGVGLQPRSKNSGRPNNDAGSERIIRYFNRNDRESIRRGAAFLGLSRMRVWRTLKLDNQRPWHLTQVQHLEQLDPVTRLAYSNWYVRQYDANPDNFPSYTMYTDESTFTQDGIINIHNEHIWAEENPHGTIDRGYQRRFSINVWGGLIDNQLVCSVDSLYNFFFFISYV